MPREIGKPKRKLPEREDALRIDIPFEEALKAALDVQPPKRSNQTSGDAKKPRGSGG